jgi:hypothetical protein
LRYELPVRAACLLLVVLAACGGSKEEESPLAHLVEHLQEHRFVVSEVTPRGDPQPSAEAVVRLEGGGTATIYAYRSDTDALAATKRFSAEEQAGPERVRVQREGLRVYVGRAPPGETLPAVDFEDVVFTAEAEHD